MNVGEGLSLKLATPFLSQQLPLFKRGDATRVQHRHFDDFSHHPSFTLSYLQQLLKQRKLPP